MHKHVECPADCSVCVLCLRLSDTHTYIHTCVHVFYFIKTDTLWSVIFNTDISFPPPPQKKAVSTGEYGCYSSRTDDDIPADISKIVSYKSVMIEPLVIRMDMLIAVKTYGFIWGIVRSVGSMLKWIQIKRSVYRSQGCNFGGIYWLRYSEVSRAAQWTISLPNDSNSWQQQRCSFPPLVPTSRHPNSPSQYSR